MPSYNLGRASGSVEIVYDSRGIARTTEDMNRLKNRLDELSRQSANISVNDFQAQRRISEITTQLHELGQERVDPEVLLSDEEFRRRFTEIQNQLLELDHDSIDPNINIHLSPEELAQLRSLRDNLEELDQQTADVNVDINTQLARRQLEELQAEINHVDGQTINVRVKVDRTAERVLGALTSIAGALFGAFKLAAIGAGILELALGALAAAGAIAEVSLGGLLALGGAFVAAASGAGLFGAAAVTDLLPLKTAYKDLATAQKQYNMATTDKQRAAALEKEQQILGQLNGDQRKLLTSVMGLKKNWEDLAQSVSPQVYKVAYNAISSIQDLLPKLKPLLGASANAFVDLSNKTKTALGSQATQSWLNFLTRQAPAAISTFGHAAGTLGSALGYTIQAFEPLIAPAEKALTGFVDRVKQKAANLTVSSGFQQFLNFIRTTAPLVGQAIGSLLTAILNLLKSLEPLAAPILKFITDFAHAISTLTQSPGFAKFVQSIGDAFTTLGTALGANANGIGDFLGNFGTLVADLFKNLAPLLPHLVKFISNIAIFLDKIVTNPGFPKLVDALGNALDKIGNALASVSPGAISAVLGFLTGIVNLAGGLLAFGHGAGVAAAGLALLLAKTRGGVGRGGAGGGGLLAGAASKLAIPLAITYVVTGALGMHKQISDIIAGDWAAAIKDQPKWQKSLGDAVANTINGVFGTHLNTSETANIEGVFISPAIQTAITKVSSVYGTKAAVAFQDALVNEKGNVQKAWNDVYGSIDPTDAGAKFLGGKGTKGGTAFWQGILGTAPGAQGAGTNIANAASAGSSFWNKAGFSNGTNGGISFWSAIRGQTPGAAAAAGGLAAAAKGGSFWNNAGFGNGTGGAVSFWQGINSQRGSAAAAAGGLAAAAAGSSFWSNAGFGRGQQGGVSFWQGIQTQRGGAAAAAGGLAATAHANLFTDGYGAGANLANSYARGIASAAGAAAAAGAALAAAVRASIPSSPAKIGPFSGHNHPEALGLRLAMLYAKGIHSGLSAVRTAGNALADAAMPGGRMSLNTTVGGAAIAGAMGGAGSTSTETTTNRKDITYAPVFQYVGPLGSDVTKEAQRGFDWSVGS